VLLCFCCFAGFCCRHLDRLDRGIQEEVLLPLRRWQEGLAVAKVRQRLLFTTVPIINDIDHPHNVQLHNAQWINKLHAVGCCDVLGGRRDWVAVVRASWIIVCFRQVSFGILVQHPTGAMVPLASHMQCGCGGCSVRC
jgi:hypothetical protein